MLNRVKIILVITYLVFSIIAINSCSVDITGAPCQTDENCPKGQSCINGKCTRGMPADIINMEDT